MASRQSRNMPRTFTLFTRSHSASVISSTKARPLTPALLNRMSSAPNFSSTAATIFFGASSAVMSAAKAAIDFVAEWTVAIADSGRSTASTCAPSSANSFADAAPMPDAAPVTMAILPESRPMMPQPTVRTTLPVALRDSSAFIASAPFSSGKVMEICGFSLPSAYQVSISSKFLRASCGSRARQAP